MKKAMWGIALALALILVLAGCGKEKVTEEINEAAEEAVINGALGGDATVDIDGDQYVFEDSEGNKTTVGGAEWPTGVSADMIPKFEKGDQTSSVVTDQFCSLQFENVEREDFDAYLETVKNAGFTQQTVEATIDTAIYYQAELDESKSISLTYDTASKIMSIISAINE
ncbi:MAG TPA: hypothetical protein PLP20_05405 [Oscillospiraceae bacterium]|nr:hypothetical protein [Oscillospiraceae bacterium]HNW03853.1 hypothetical protein [Oscillospiraceae bacterium]HPW00473.1 hypothetical protein [Oscillospiraceae bacterium]